MNPAQKDVRRAAARAFMESLDVLACHLAAETENLQRPSSRSTATSTPTCSKTETRSLVKEFEEAVADIDQHSQS